MDGALRREGGPEGAIRMIATEGQIHLSPTLKVFHEERLAVIPKNGDRARKGDCQIKCQILSDSDSMARSPFSLYKRKTAYAYALSALAERK
jgi:hypothetical protein